MPAKPFPKGHTGRPRGAKNRLEKSFLEALADDFAAHGADAIKICRIERPDTYVKIVASLMPKSLELTAHSIERELSDEELAIALDKIRQLRASAIDAVAVDITDAPPMKVISDARTKP